MSSNLNGLLCPRSMLRAKLAASLGIACLLGAVSMVSAKDKSLPTGDWKPRIHFYAGPLWNNDPNGPILLNGQYHLFYQANPYGDTWGNMSWGHTVSTDLVHWTKLPLAIPGSPTQAIFSGSVVEDRQNTSGLCGGVSPADAACLVAIYTGDSKTSQGAGRQNQNLAVSRDGGSTWTHYANNPVLDLAMDQFRDPKVFWHEPTHSWIMLAVFSAQHTAEIFRSKDLKKWEHASTFGPAGATGGVWECPDLLNLAVRDARGNKVGSHWVMSVNLNPGAVAGGSGNQYFLGQFDGTKFVADRPKSRTLWVDWGKDFYASTSFAGTPGDEDKLWLAWMNNWNYAGKTPSLPGRGEMTLARHLYLRQDSAKGAPEPLVLVQEPVLQKFSADTARGLLSIEEANARFQTGGPESGVYVLRTTLVPGGASELGVRLRRNSLRAGDAASEETIVGIDRAKGEIFVDRRRSGYVSFAQDFPVRTAAPLKHPEAKEIPLEIVVDRNSIEVFAEDGETVLTNLIFPSDTSQGLAFYATGNPAGGDAAHLNNLKVAPLQ